MLGNHPNCDPQFYTHISSSAEATDICTRSTNEEDCSISEEISPHVKPLDYLDQLNVIMSEEKGGKVTAEAEVDAMKGGNYSSLNSPPSVL